jgi:hypothetical protein
MNCARFWMEPWRYIQRWGRCITGYSSVRMKRQKSSGDGQNHPQLHRAAAAVRFFHLFYRAVNTSRSTRAGRDLKGVAGGSKRT